MGYARILAYDIEHFMFCVCFDCIVTKKLDVIYMYPIEKTIRLPWSDMRAGSLTFASIVDMKKNGKVPMAL